MLKLNIGVIVSVTLVAFCQCSANEYVPAPVKVASNPFVKKFVGILKKEDLHKNQISATSHHDVSNLGVKHVGNVPSHDTTGFVDPFYGKSGHDAIVKVDTSGSSHADLSVSSSGHGTGNNLLPGVSYVTDVGSSGDRKKDNVHGSHARTDTTGFVDPFYGKSIHNAPVKVDTSGSSHADLSVSSSGHGTGSNLLPGVSYITDVGSSGDRKKTNVHGSYARTGGDDFVDPFYSNSDDNVPTHVDPYQPTYVAATSGNGQHKLHGVSYVTDDSYNDNWGNDVPVGTPSNEYVDNAVNDFVDPFYAKNGNSHMPRQYVGNGVSAPSGTPYRSDFAQYVNHNSDQFVDPFYAKKGNNPTNYNYNAGNSYPSIGSSSWSDVFNKKGLVFVEWPLKSQKSTEPNVVCMDKRNSVPSVYIKIEGLDDPLCMHLKVPNHKQKTLIKHGDETLGIKTSLCESTVQKEVYSADYINAAYIPDHQITMYPDMILEDLTFRQWNDGEIADLPFPSKQMKIKACRSDGSLRGLQFYIDASTPNTDYSGILGPLANMKLHKFDTSREGEGKTVANIVVKNANKKYEFKSVLRYGVSRLSQQCWETTDTSFLNLD
ncbi:Hypothetical predicted protein [Mytilus galloprovincialis]|uniref:Uncharacterized protein n=1 Tax=Mytilus galloprovincialis TaxID=29158 RepID=A0A8B6C985_MYTGA|nr:Hypothetical predicted protein [Mytilus galloprovincialis]